MGREGQAGEGWCGRWVEKGRVVLEQGMGRAWRVEVSTGTGQMK